MSVFAASSWAAVAAVAHQLEREAVGLDPALACALRTFARRLHAARLLARHLFTATTPSRHEVDEPVARDDLHDEEGCG